MAQGALYPFAKIQFLDNSGNPVAGGLLYTYSAGTVTPLATYSDSALTVPNANPVVLDAAGRAAVYISPLSYFITLKTSAGVTIWTQDNVYDIASLIVAGLAQFAVPSSTLAGLPAAGTAGRVARVTNIYPGLYMDNGAAWAPVNLTMAATFAALPAAGTAGRIARVTDTLGGIWHDSGVQWVKDFPDVNVKDAPFNARGNGVTDDTAAFAAAIAALSSTGGVIVVPPGIYMVDSISVTGDLAIQMRGSQGSFLPSTLTKGSIIRCRGAVTNFVTLQGRFHSYHDLIFDGAGLATNVVRLNPTTTGINFYRCAFIRPVPTTGTIFNAPNAGNGEIDHCNWEWCLFHGDPTGAAVAAIGFNLAGSNAFMNQFHDCLFFNITNAVTIANGGVSFKTCDFLAIGYGCITITDGHDTIRIEDCYTESDCVYFIYHSVTLSNGDKPLLVSGNMINSAVPLVNYSTGQPVISIGNQFVAGCVIDNTGRYNVISIGDNFARTANDFSGAGVARLDRFSEFINGAQVTGLASPVNVTGLLTTSTAVFGSSTLTAALSRTGVITPTQLSADVNNYNPTGLSASTGARVDPGAAARNITGMVSTGAGRQVSIYNISTTAGRNIVLVHQSGSSDAANRFVCPNLADHTIRPGGSALLEYDGTSSFWRVISA